MPQINAPDISIHRPTAQGPPINDRKAADSSSENVHRSRQQIAIPEPSDGCCYRRAIVLKWRMRIAPIQIAPVDCPHPYGRVRRPPRRSFIHDYFLQRGIEPCIHLSNCPTDAASATPETLIQSRAFSTDLPPIRKKSPSSAQNSHWGRVAGRVSSRRGLCKHDKRISQLLWKLR
jgi:hypothetical protein